MAQPKSASSSERSTTQELAEEIRLLERRLRDGEEVVRRSKQSGGDPELIERWESAWIKLLRQYELLCDRAERQSLAQRARESGETSGP